jgi:hypothetical protein
LRVKIRILPRNPRPISVPQKGQRIWIFALTFPMVCVDLLGVKSNAKIQKSNAKIRKVNANDKKVNTKFRKVNTKIQMRWTRTTTPFPQRKSVEGLRFSSFVLLLSYPKSNENHYIRTLEQNLYEHIFQEYKQ